MRLAIKTTSKTPGPRAGAWRHLAESGLDLDRFHRDFGNGILVKLPDSESVRWEPSIRSLFACSMNRANNRYRLLRGNGAPAQGRAPDSASEVQCPW